MKFCLTAFACVGLAGFASAAACTGGSFSGIDLFQNGNTLVASPGTITCAISAPAGNYLTGVTLNTISDFSNPSAGATVTLRVNNFNSSVPALGILVPTQFTLAGTQVLSTTSANNANQGITGITVTFNSAFVGQTGTVDAATLNANGLAGTSGTAIGACGTNLGCSANVFQSGIFISYAPTTQGVPEPATLGLLGGALLGLGLISRKKK